MASVDEVYQQVVTGLSSTEDAFITIVSNQPDGTCAFIGITSSQGNGIRLNRLDNQAGLEGMAIMLFSSQRNSFMLPTGPTPQQPFPVNPLQQQQVSIHVSLTSPGPGQYTLLLDSILFPLAGGFNHVMTLTSAGDVSYGFTPAIGSNEATDVAMYLISLRLGKPIRNDP